MAKTIKKVKSKTGRKIIKDGVNLQRTVNAHHYGFISNFIDSTLEKEGEEIEQRLNLKTVSFDKDLDIIYIITKTSKIDLTLKNFLSNEFNLDHYDFLSRIKLEAVQMALKNM